jgi:hypothetical protein
MSEANVQTCDTMADAVVIAEAWTLDKASPEEVAELRAWVRLRMQAYIDGGWDGEEADLVEWIAMDLAIDDDGAGRLCELAGWVKPVATTSPPCCRGSRS